MTLETLMIVTSLCSAPTFSPGACEPASKAFLMQEGYWQQGEKVTKWATNQVGKTEAVIIGTTIIYARDKSLNFKFGPDKRYKINYTNKDYSGSITLPIF